MDEDNPGNLHGNILTKFNGIHTPRTINIDDQHIIFEKIDYSWREIIFPLTLMVISIISVVLISIILIFWLKHNNKTNSERNIKMSKDLNNLEENLDHEDHSQDAMLILNLKDRLDECNELENFSDENHSPNVDKVNKLERRLQKSDSSPKYLKETETTDTKKQWILHSAPPLDIKHDVCIQPSLEPKSSKGYSSPLKCSTPTIFKFEVRSALDMTDKAETNIFNFSLNSPLSSNDSANYYTPKTFFPEISAEMNKSEEVGITECQSKCNRNLCTRPFKPNQSKEGTSTSDISTRFDYSPKSCEYYSAKSTLKTPYEYFKFPEPQCPLELKDEEYKSADDNSHYDSSGTNLQMVPSDSLKIEASAIMHRRARLKSISLDSEGASLVEAHLGVPMISLMQETNEDDYTINNNRIHTMTGVGSENYRDVNSNSANASKRPRNLNSLALNLDYKDDSLSHDNAQDDMPKTPKTPTLTQTKQKAISLDSSDAFTPLVPLARGSLYTQNSSVSVPNTPKRFTKKMTHKTPHMMKSSYYSNMCNPDSLNMSGIGEHLPSSRSYNQKLMHYTRKMGSFDENTMELSCMKHSTCNKSESLLSTNLQHFKSSLSVSNNNLKTLPEVMPLSDFKFDGNMTKKSILQRRGSNQSLTLNLDSNFRSSFFSLQGSISNLSNTRALSSSNYSLQATSSYNIYDHGSKSKKCLLQRRGSNNSLSLNLQKSNLNLNRFNSQSSLSINIQDRNSYKRGLLERRNSNTSLTLNLTQAVPTVSGVGDLFKDTAVVAGYNEGDAPMSPAPVASSVSHHRKSLSTESLFESSDTASSRDTTFGSVDDVRPRRRWDDDASGALCHGRGYRPIRNITTRPLSPQANSEDFKTYLASLQILQNATNVLCRAQLRDLNSVFQQGYTSAIVDKNACSSRAIQSSEVNCKNTLSCKNALEIKSSESEVFNIEQEKVFSKSGFSSVSTLSSAAALINNIHSNLTSSKVEDTHTLYIAVSDEGLKKEIQRKNESECLSNIDKFFVSPPMMENQKKALLHNLHKEFWNLPNNFQDKPIVFGSQGKNRYKSILPNEHSRVILDIRSTNNKEGYINANYIKGYDNTTNAFIVTQGPLPNTVYDFWCMVHQNCKRTDRCGQDVRTTPAPQKIVMLTNFSESNRQKCAVYFPIRHGDTLRFSDDDAVDSATAGLSFSVTNTGLRRRQGYSLRQLVVQIHSEDNQEDIIAYHYWFECWPDHRSPDDVNVLLDMCLHVLDADCQLEFMSGCSEDAGTSSEIGTGSNSNDIYCANCGPLPIVHCSAGIGRTGCLVAILNGVKQFRDTNRVDVLGIVCNMRLSRGGMIQNSEQYELVHRVLCLFEQRLS